MSALTCARIPGALRLPAPFCLAPLCAAMLCSPLVLADDATIELAPLVITGASHHSPLTVVKGPQSVLWGPGGSAATILFERGTPAFNALGWTPDGSQFLRESLGLRFRKDNSGELFGALEGQVYNSYADHVMDNFSLRNPSADRDGCHPYRRSSRLG